MAGRRPRRASRPQRFIGFMEDLFPSVMRYGGFVIAMWAAFVHRFDRPSLYVLALGMMGGEPIIRWWRRQRDGNEP